MSLKDSYAFVKEKRKMAEPNAHFIYFLSEFENSEMISKLREELVYLDCGMYNCHYFVTIPIFLFNFFWQTNFIITLICKYQILRFLDFQLFPSFCL